MDAEREKIRAIARQILAWLKSEEGQQAMRESRDRVVETSALLDKAREIDPAKLHQPFTV